MHFVKTFSFIVRCIQSVWGGRPRSKFATGKRL